LGDFLDMLAEQAAKSRRFAQKSRLVARILRKNVKTQASVPCLALSQRSADIYTNRALSTTFCAAFPGILAGVDACATLRILEAAQRNPRAQPSTYIIEDQGLWLQVPLRGMTHRAASEASVAVLRTSI
jgi:hypothetical protein